MRPALAFLASGLLLLLLTGQQGGCTSQSPTTPDSTRDDLESFGNPISGAHDDYLWNACGDEEYEHNKRHLGSDLSAFQGLNVYAVADGKVRYVSSGGWDLNGCSTGLVGLIIEHESDKEPFLAVYGHVNNLKVRAGETVDKSDWIAEVGCDHLHFGVHPGSGDPPIDGFENGWGKRLEPGCTRKESKPNGFVAPLAYLDSHKARKLN